MSAVFFDSIISNSRAFAAQPAPNTLIQNQASVFYVDPVDGGNIEVMSNTANLRTAGMLSLDLQQDTVIVSSQLSTVNISHVLTNSGNLQDSYALTSNNIAGDDFDITGLAVYQDVNNNGQVDAGEPLLNSTPILMPNQTINLVLTGQVPNGSFTNGVQAQIQLLAVSTLDASIAAQNMDTVIVSDQATFNITKTNSPECTTPILPNNDIDYILTLENISTLTPSGQDYSIDGVLQTGVVLTDIIPANTFLFKPQTLNVSPATASPVVQLANQFQSNNWVSFANWNGTDAIAQVGVFSSIADVAPNQKIELGFSLRVNDFISFGTIIRNVASLDLDNDNIAEFSSQEVCNTITPQDSVGNTVNAQIRFLQPQNSLQVANTPANFNNDNDFEDVGVYRLNSSLNPNLNSDSYNATNNGIYLEVRSTSLNNVSYLADGSVTANAGTIQVRLESVSTADFINVVMLETSPNSGVFRSLHPITLSTTVAGAGATCSAGNVTPDYTNINTTQCILLSQANDNLRASILDPGLGDVIVDSAVVDPLGIVFDSTTGNAIAGAVVSIIDVATGQRALDPDTGGTTQLASQTTLVDGRYQYPRVFPGTYYLDIQPPAGYSFPSEVASADLPAGFTISESSYGRNGFDQTTPDTGLFVLEVGDPPLVVDLPLDAGALPPVSDDRPNLVVDKSISLGNQATDFYKVDIGDRLKYNIMVRNIGTETSLSTRLIDTLPYGFKFESGTARQDGAAIIPDISQAGQLIFDLEQIAPNAEIELTYILKITAGAVDSDGINIAYAQGVGEISNATVISEESSVKAEINRRGLLSDRTVLFGKVFIDANCDGIQKNGEWPIGGVRIYMEDGTYVITDENGQYSLYGVNPGQHVLKLDQLSLPEGIQGIPVDTRSGADPYSRFVDVWTYEYHRADFVFACPHENAPEVIAQLEKRNQSINGQWLFEEAIKYNGSFGSGTLNSNNKKFSRANVKPSFDGDISNSVIGNRKINASFNNNLNNNKSNENESLSRNANQLSSLAPSSALAQNPKKRMPLTKDAAQTVTTKMAKAGEWLWPLNEVSHSGRFMVVVRAGVKPTLKLNGEAVNSSRLGEHIINKKQKAQVLAWYGLPLEQGYNSLEVSGVDMFGNDRVMAKKRIYHPGKAVAIKVQPHTQSIPADGGRSALAIDLLLEDENGMPAAGVYYATVEAEQGTWLENDMQDLVMGHQIKIDNGRGLVHLRSSDFTGKVATKITVNELEKNLTLNFLPVLRPMIAVGLIDIGGTYNNIDADNFQPTQQADGFKDSLNIDGRAAVFLKGKIKGDLLLTLSYDSDKDPDAEQFRDIDPEGYYPIYGDASIKGYDAQSQSKLYVKVEKNRNSILWGDYQTDANPVLASSITRVSQTLTGLNINLDNEKGTRVSVYGAQAENTFETETLPGRGLATGYQLDFSRLPMAINSEQISIVTFDRENSLANTGVNNVSQSGQIINEEKLQRFRDYTVNTLTGVINFTDPIPSFDDQGKPIFIRVTYQSESNPSAHIVAGARISHALSPSLTIGAAVSTDDDEDNGYTMGSIFAEFSPNDNHSVMVELGQLENEAGSLASNPNSNLDLKGNAMQFEWKSKWTKKLDTHLRIGKADEEFTNNISPISSGREETRFKANYALTNKTAIAIDTLKSESSRDSVIDKRELNTVTVSQQLGKWIATAGARQTRQENANGSSKFDSLVARVDRNFTLSNKQGRVFVEGEKEIGDGSRSRLEASAEYQLHDKVSMYARHEVTDSLAGSSALSQDDRRSNSAIGVKTDFIKSSEIYSEYRVRGAIEGRDVEAVNGMRGAWELKPGLAITPAFEVVKTMEGDGARDATALSVALIDNRKKNVKKAVRLEARKAQTSDTYAFDYSYAGRINEDWSSLFINRFRLTEQDDIDDQLRNALTASFSRRPREDNQWHSLYMMQWKEERNITEEERSVFVLSTHQNYQFDYNLSLSARMGLKWQTQTIDDFKFDSTSQLLGARLIWGLNKRWDLDIRAGALSADLSEDIRYSAGIGAHYLIDKNVRLGAGFNFTGFDDKDLDAQKYHSEGLFFGVQFKFDESLFEWAR